MSRLRNRVLPLAEQLYPGRGQEVADRLLALVDGRSGPGRARPDEGTSYLITYGDAVRRPGETPLHTLAEVLRDHVGDIVSDVHLLPMFPWTSDDGFAVVDHREVNPALGTWDDLAELEKHHGLMFDFVANHVSASSQWFRGWLAGDPAYDGFFIARDPAFDASRVVRPRVSPLFHPFERGDGRTVEAWTTFGADQVDVNVGTVEALLELTDVLVGYVERGASAVRLDAIGFLWKESGTTCLHLPQTHAVVKLWRAVVDHVAPGTQLLTETNVPHAENVAYFGDGTDEAHLVYQFALPPLVLHSFVSGSTEKLTAWARDITGPVGENATWFNFLASHDGIGLRPTEGILDDEERQALVARTLAHGGAVSMASVDGRQSVYELNISFLDALVTPEDVRDAEAVAARALAAHSILLSFIGVPAIYYHSLFGSSADREGMRISGINRRINRAVLDADALERELHEDPRRSLVFTGIAGLMAARRQHAAFSPYGAQQVEDHGAGVFVVRRAVGTDDEIVCATNVRGEAAVLPAVSGTDVLTGRRHDPLLLPPYGYAWIRPGRG
ncbi:sugar phosphorylase [Nocardioides sp. T2.26MG-1]|uniref:sugar phosphorylase n=1 Tax=Nocardioides sp. T2.26MG-1 TaxID=3041166 RepID=UPI0024775830|nr:sugar phosphorylase [Nocardioides sp. T2.26MG-1]CAI9403541.1 Glucosylglycerate phosphorylase [Nocardioides sp. T2.26MG-1]